MKTKVLLDTDIGSDIDDAVCLAYLLAQPSCDLLGITTVTGEALKRAMLASAICKVAGKDVPIYPGAEQPYNGLEQLQPLAPQAVALARWAHDTDFPQEQAIDFMRKMIRANPGEVVLLSVGPLTNIGRLFEVDPEIPRIIKGLVMMSGSFTGRIELNGVGEWNARCDPYATEIVYNSRPRIHRSIGLDVTMQTALPAANVRKKFTAPLLRPVLDFAEVWFEHVESLVFHDPLAATTIFDETICVFQRGIAYVSAIDFPGITKWTPDSNGPHEVAIDVNVDRFYEHYFSLF